ncbi:hypothetical protein ACE1ET_11385 [Saccharicrinis sp. FJH62]|uniref:hypothetical protein n=1 Tax=Saccharicrinis sp. FJH62 TaxID=3344657 RepID=UPI0035D4A674
MIKRKYLFVIFLSLLSCTQKISNPYEKTVPLYLDIDIINPYFGEEPNRYIKDIYSGQLTLINNEKDTFNYDVINSSNLLEVPFGFFSGYIHDFPGFSMDSIEVVALGGYDTITLNARISHIPDYTAKIISDSVKYEHYLYLYIKVPFRNKVSRIEFWGSNDTLNSDIQFLFSRYIDIRNDSIGYFASADINSEKIFNYYNLAVVPYEGYVRTVQRSGWYQIKSSIQ